MKGMMTPWNRFFCLFVADQTRLRPRRSRRKMIIVLELFHL